MGLPVVGLTTDDGRPTSDTANDRYGQPGNVRSR
jgi:hypothetical protein